jgi:hypothetical protein
MLENNKLLIDKACPMCKIYARGFEKIKLIDDKTVTYYQEAEPETFDKIDAKRAMNEVALVNTENGDVVYGAKAFTTILSQNRKWLNVFFDWGPIRWFIQQLYWFISYNRHVMAGPRELNASRACIPETKASYRWLYILSVALITGLILNQFSYLLADAFGVSHNNWREYLICFGQIGWQFTLLSIIRPGKKLDYLGNMSTVSFIGAILLLPVILLSQVITLNGFVLGSIFMLVVSYMLSMHYQRTKKMQLPITITAYWLLYRVGWLIVILWIELI